MAKKKQTRLLKVSRLHSVEWLGAIVSLPIPVVLEDDAYKPDVVIWMSPDGMVRGFTMEKPAALQQTVCDDLRRFIDDATGDNLPNPTCLRVPNAKLANALRQAYPDLDVLCAPVPEMDVVIKDFLLHVTTGGENLTEDGSWLPDDVDDTAIAMFFKTVAALYRAKPWNVIPNSNCIISATSRKLKLNKAVVAVIGQMKQDFGFLLFDTIEDYEAYGLAAENHESGMEVEIPPHVALNFDRGSTVPASLRKKISGFQWEVASARAYPCVFAVQKNQLPRRINAVDLTKLEAVAHALTGLAAKKAEIHQAADGGPLVKITSSFPSLKGPINIALQVPHPADQIDLIAEFRQLELRSEGDELEPQRRSVLENKLMRAFTDSPEAEKFDDTGAACLVLDLAANYFGATVATLTATDLAEILFEILPRKALLDRPHASKLFSEVQALYRFLQRRYKLKQADDCLAVLSNKASKQFLAAVMDDRKHGLMKSLLVAGSKAGYDIESQGGLTKFMHAITDQQMDAPFEILESGLSATEDGTSPPTAKKSRKKAKKKT